MANRNPRAVTEGPADEPQRTKPARKTTAQPGDLTQGVQFFDGTITKINAAGHDVLSDHVAPGEQLRRATTDRYTAVRPS